MMKTIYEINAVPYGSTASVMAGVSKKARDYGYNCITVTGFSSHPDICLIKENYMCMGKYEKVIHMVCAKISGLNGCFSILNTFKLIINMKKNNVDIIHLHNLHGWYVNLPLLFYFIKKNNIKVIWTLHDCWAFTGHCPHFDMIGCNRWKEGCCGCSQYKNYPKSFFDNSKFMYNKKKKWFKGVNNLIIITPSQWLSDIVKQSFLKEYDVKVINNGIDLKVFKPISSDFREKYNCINKKIILGVSFGWEVKKGLDVFIELAKRLSSDYQIILVGTNDKVDSLLPSNIISIHRTQNKSDLAKIYSAADLFVNPTREENYPTVNMESLACGTPVLTFKTGGSPEIIDDTCGCVVDKNDFNTLEKEVVRICENHVFSEDVCLKKAESFDVNERFEEYIRLFNEQI